MTTPGSEPGDTVPPDPAVTPEEAAAQAAQQAAAEAAAALNNQIRDLAAEIAKQTMMSFDPCTLRKGVVVSVQNTATPPTLTVTISGDTLQIPGVVYYEHYVPQATDVVHLIKQGTDLVAIGKVAEQHTETAFSDVTLSGGFTHNGNGNGNLKIRRVWDNGVWRVDFQGSVARSSGTVIATGLDTKYRPTSATRRTLTCARDATTQNSVKVDVGADGTLTMVGGPTGTSSTDPGDTGTTTPNDSAHTHGGNTDGATPNTNSHTHGASTGGFDYGAVSHSHGGAVATSTFDLSNHDHSIANTDHNHGSHSHGVPESSHNHGGHNHTMGTHSHSGTDPVWISFNSQSYFL